MNTQKMRGLDEDLFTAHELETIYHVFYQMARTETNQKFMNEYERIANFAINERARISPNYIEENYS